MWSFAFAPQCLNHIDDAGLFRTRCSLTRSLFKLAAKGILPDQYTGFVNRPRVYLFLYRSLRRVSAAFSFLWGDSERNSSSFFTTVGSRSWGFNCPSHFLDSPFPPPQFSGQ
uniref:Uncharacterized protein n=1 Tax=Sphaerodactylus townsendi TaxID=933632 RepID=A0ACB8ELU0_9SAUR